MSPGDISTGRFMGTRAVDQSRLVETGTLDRMLRVDGRGTGKRLIKIS